MTDPGRRALLGAAAAALAGLAGCAALRDAVRRYAGANWAPLPVPESSEALDRARLVLNRAAYGPAPGDLARALDTGIRGWIESQLADEGSDSPAVSLRIAGLETVEGATDAPDRFASLSDAQLMDELQRAVIVRAVYSQAQLREVMADFWTNHFNIYALKADGRVLLPVFIETALRPHVLGNFREMLLATARSPAMLAYLDNQRNRRGVANENYARELMELHTVGVHGGYSQSDIRVLARALTGWTVAEGFSRGQFRFDRALHDIEAKRAPFLDLILPPDGDQREAESAISRLAEHPATGRYLARKLCVRFLGHAPENVLSAAANAYASSDCAIRPMLRPILLDALASRGDVRPSLKRPFDFVVSALRALGADTDGGPSIQTRLAEMGQPLYQWPMPDGFPDRTAAWTGSLLPRWNFALDLCSGKLDGVTVRPLEAPLADGDRTPLRAPSAIVSALLGRSPDDPIARSIAATIQEGLQSSRADRSNLKDVVANTAGLTLCASAFQWRG